MDFSSFDRDLEELKADVKVREALESGVELTGYASKIQQDLEELVKNSIPDYVREAPETAALNAEIEACDSVLGSIETILHEFQRDLGDISDEIRFLQEESLSMGVKLKNRKEVEIRIRSFLEKITVPESLVRDICEKEVNQEYSEITLKRLDEHMSFARERDSGILLVKAAATSPKGQKRIGDNTSDPSTYENVLMSIPPCDTAAAQDVEPQLEKLRLRATAKTRQFFMDRIASLKKPSTNVQILQQDLLRFRYASRFLQRHAPNVAEEIRSTYIDSMKNILISLFKTYHTQLLKLVAGQNTTLNPMLAATSSAGVDLLASTTRRPDTMPLTQREQEMGAPDALPLVVHLIQDKKLPYEATFRSEQKHLIDSATSEYIFLLEFFGGSSLSIRGEESYTKRARQTADSLFEQVFGRTLQNTLDQLDSYLSTATDPVSLLLMIKVAQSHRNIMRKRRVVVLESYFDQIDQKLWPSLKKLIDMNIKSLIQADARKLLGPKLDTQAHFWTRKYGLFAANIYAVSSELDEHSDGSIHRALEIARSKAIELLQRMAQCFSNNKSKAVFMINSCDSIIGAFCEVGRVLPADAATFEDLSVANKDLYVEEELQEYFGRMIRFLRAAELEGANIDDKEVKDLINDFAANWRSGADLINASIATHFPSFASGKDILKACFTQLCVFYQRFREIVSQRTAINTSRLVEMSVLYAECDRYFKNHI